MSIGPTTTKSPTMPARAAFESMRALEGLDRLVGFLADVVRATGTPIRDRGPLRSRQAQGATFRQRSGMTLHDLVESLTEGQGRECTGLAAIGASRALELGQPGLERSGSLSAMTARAIRALMRVGTRGAEVPRRLVTALARESKAPVVAASGSLAHIYLPELPRSSGPGCHR